MREPSISDQADLALLAVLFFFLVLFASSMSEAGQDTAPEQPRLESVVAANQATIPAAYAYQSIRPAAIAE